MHGWHIDALCDHLEAVLWTVTDEEISRLADEYELDGSPGLNRLLANVPPGTMKSLTCSVFFPAWAWGPRNLPHLRFLCASHSQSLSIRDSTKMRRLVSSEWYQKRWGDRVVLTGDQNAKTKFENTAAGFREAVAAGSITGARGDIVIIDDPHSVESAASDQMRATTKEWFLEAVPSRLNNPERSAIIVIMQRLHQDDISGVIIDGRLGYEHLCLPMEFEADRRCETSIGFADPREEDRELLFPERFTAEVVARDKRVMGPAAVAGQFQQSPSPRGGGIIKREWWQTWDEVAAKEQGVKSNSFPPMDVVIASLDTAYTEKQENDPSALTIWGVWQRNSRLAKSYLNERGERIVFDESVESIPQVMLMTAWEKRLAIHGPEVARFPDEMDAEFQLRTQSEWGLCEWVAHSCNKLKVDILLIEAKASGISVAQELKRLNKYANWQVRLINPGAQDKVARAYSIQASFSNGVVWAPDRDWAEKVITQCEVFPKGKHDDFVDTTTQALRYIRDNGLLQRADEIAAQVTIGAQHRPKAGALYDV